MKQADLRIAYQPPRVPGGSRMPLGPAIHAPLAGLAGTDLSRRFCYWRGASGHRYLFSVFRLGSRKVEDRCPGFERAIVLAVAHGQNGEREIVCAGETGSEPQAYFESRGLQDAIAAGANEIHVHLLTRDLEARTAILRDLET